MNDPTIPTDPYARLARHRVNGWNIAGDRDGIKMLSALKRPTESSLIYLVASDAAELVALIDQIEQSAGSPQQSAESPRDTDQP